MHEGYSFSGGYPNKLQSQMPLGPPILLSPTISVHLPTPLFSLACSAVFLPGCWWLGIFSQPLSVSCWGWVLPILAVPLTGPVFPLSGRHRGHLPCLTLLPPHTLLPPQHQPHVFTYTDTFMALAETDRY